MAPGGERSLVHLHRISAVVLDLLLFCRLLVVARWPARLAMAELLLFHLGLLASTSILGAVSIQASRMISGAEDDWPYLCRNLVVLMSEHATKLKLSQRSVDCVCSVRVGKDTSNDTTEGARVQYLQGKSASTRAWTRYPSQMMLERLEYLY